MPMMIYVKAKVTSSSCNVYAKNSEKGMEWEAFCIWKDSFFKAVGKPCTVGGLVMNISKVQLLEKILQRWFYIHSFIPTN